MQSRVKQCRRSSAMAVNSCRLCQAAVLAKEAVAIFVPTVAKQSVPSRIEDLLGVRVVQNMQKP